MEGGEIEDVMNSKSGNCWQLAVDICSRVQEGGQVSSQIKNAGDQENASNSEVIKIPILDKLNLGTLVL